MFGDTFTLYREGQAWLEGRYEGLYPLPFVMLWSLLARLRIEVVVAGVLAASVILCVVLFKREALLWILYLPILETLVLGQLSMIWLVLLRSGAGWGFALLTLKPQLFLLAIPAIAARREVWRSFGVAVALLYIPSLVVRPMWLIEWLQHIFRDTRFNDGMSASLWAVPLLAFSCAAALLLTRRYSWLVIFTTYNPAFRPYDYALLAGNSRWMILMSWIIFGIMALLGMRAAWPMALLGIAAAMLENEPSKQSHLTRSRVRGNLAA